MDRQLRPAALVTTAADPDLKWRGRRIIAERCSWPAGVLEECERLDAEHPGWYVGYRDANTIKGFEHPAGFYGSFRGPMRYVAVCGETVEALSDAIACAPEVRHWMFETICCGPRLLASDPWL